MSQMVRIKGVSKRFGETTALDNININIEESQFFAIVGPSGSGKSTLLHILGGFTDPSAGQVFIADRDVTTLPAAKRPTTSMFQDYALFPHMSVGTNVGFGLLMRKVPKAERQARIEDALNLVGLSGMSARRIHQLSGGQQQRVALARALVVEPKVLLLDEPLGALDLNLRKQMQKELLHIQKQLGTTFVHVTHDQEEAMTIADVIAVMNQGQVEDIGPPKRVYLKPRTRFVAKFMGESNIIEGRVIAELKGKVEVETALGRLVVPGKADRGAIIHLSLRPEQIAAKQAGNERYLGLGEVIAQEVSFFGTHQRCAGRHVESEIIFTIHLPQNQTLKLGEKIDLTIALNDIALLTR
jgi:spermidine/putrescine transport system ATP-binding protein